MARRFVVAPIVSSALGLSNLADGAVRACGNGDCSELWDYCRETAEYFYDEYRECCTGVCRGPHPTWQCNNDSNQCTCHEIGR